MRKTYLKTRVAKFYNKRIVNATPLLRSAFQTTFVFSQHSSIFLPFVFYVKVGLEWEKYMK
jgi:hypothetical protein